MIVNFYKRNLFINRMRLLCIQNPTFTIIVQLTWVLSRTRQWCSKWQIGRGIIFPSPKWTQFKRKRITIIHTCPLFLITPRTNGFQALVDCLTTLMAKKIEISQRRDIRIWTLREDHQVSSTRNPSTCIIIWRKHTLEEVTKATIKAPTAISMLTPMLLISFLQEEVVSRMT